MRTPSSRMAARDAAAATVSPSRLPSVTSNHSADGSIPGTARTWATVSGRSGRFSWRADRLTDTAEGDPGPGVPDGGLAARLRQHPLAEGLDEPGLLGDGDELHRVDESPRRVGPPHQCLDADDLAVAQRALGLVVDHELALVQGAVQVALGLQPVDHTFVHVFVVDGEPAAEVLL